MSVIDRISKFLGLIETGGDQTAFVPCCFWQAFQFIWNYDWEYFRATNMETLTNIVFQPSSRDLIMGTAHATSNANLRQHKRAAAMLTYICQKYQLFLSKGYLEA